MSWDEITPAGGARSSQVSMAAARPALGSRDVLVPARGRLRPGAGSTWSSRGDGTARGTQATGAPRSTWLASGLATATVRELCRLAAARHGLRTLRAATSRENTASQKVLTKAGFVPVGPADPAHSAVSKAPGTSAT